MPIDLSKVDLDSPAFGEEVKTEEAPKETATAEAPQAESGEEGAPPSVGEADVEQKVPYSRMAAVIEQRREAERRAAELEDRLQQVQREREDARRYRPEEPTDGSLPSWWVSLYGDNDNSRNAYRYELERQDQIRQDVRREAVEAVREERAQEGKVLSQNIGVIDERLGDLALSLGRDLTEQEESSLLDIVDEYTPKDDNGNYSGDLIPMDKAWEILNLKQSKVQSRQSQARREVTAATSSRTDTERVSLERSNADFNPRDWNAWQKRIPN